MTQTFIKVQTSMPGFHCWPEAVGKREYLKSVHRHLFIITCTMKVTDPNRQVEFHNLQEELYRTSRSHIGHSIRDHSWILERSCETMADRIVLDLSYVYPHCEWIEVTVSEDGECTGIVQYTKEPFEARVLPAYTNPADTDIPF